jgi:hypothetical protein
MKGPHSQWARPMYNENANSCNKLHYLNGKPSAIRICAGGGWRVGAPSFGSSPLMSVNFQISPQQSERERSCKAKETETGQAQPLQNCFAK